MVIELIRQVHSLQLTDKLFPGTEYGLYCSEETSSWPEVKETENFVKTEGCFDCGIKPYPEVMACFDHRIPSRDDL